MKVDLKDRKILYELDLNARISYTQLAKKVGLSQESARYRVERLMRTGIIQKFFTVINPAKLNFVFYKVLLRLHNVNERLKLEIIDYLRKDKQIVWLVEIDGSYDLGFVAKISSVMELNNFLENLYQKFHQYISKHEVSTNILGEYLTREYLIDKRRDASKIELSYTAKLAPYETDDIDIGTIKNLTENARTSAAEMAKKLYVSIDTILNRMKSLQKNGVITKFNIVLNNDRLNQIHYKVLIFLNDFSLNKILQFLSYCRSINRIVYIIKAMGNWNFELDIEVQNIDQFRRIMMELTEKFSEIIRDYDALIIMRIHKYNLYP